MIEIKKTNRGFATGSFVDRYGAACSVQKSSLATEDCLWLGVDEVWPQVLASHHPQLTKETTGWIPWPTPVNAQVCGKMHLTREQVSDLLPLLRHFVKTGELPTPTQERPAPWPKTYAH